MPKPKPNPRPRPDFTFELKHRAEGRIAVGVDEVGRGCLAGPVVTAAVVLPSYMAEQPPVSGKPLGSLDPDGPWWHHLNDSKLLTPAARERLAQLIRKHARVEVAWCSVEEIDRWNILHAAMVAMRKALEPFQGLAQAVLVDGHINPFEPRYQCRPGEAARLGFTRVELLVKGDQRSASIAAASIVAKVYRDRWMTELAAAHPGYGFETHKGYSTPEHYAGIARLGPCVLHRLSFEPFKSARPGSCSPEKGGKENKPSAV